MRSLVARLATLAVFAMALTACTAGGSSLPFAGPPNNAGGVPGTIQAGSNGLALIRFVQGSPDYGNVDVCIDAVQIQPQGSSIAYGRTSNLYNVAGGIPHTIAVYPSGVPAGAECPTAPGPFFGTAAIGTSILNVGNNVRWTIVLGGTAATGTLGLYVYADPTFTVGTPSAQAISHNAAPAFTSTQARGIGVGFGTCSTTVTPCATPAALPGANNVQPRNCIAGSPAPCTGAVANTQPVPSGTASSVLNPVVPSPLPAIPAGFYDGVGVTAGAPVPITSIPAPAAQTGQPYVVQLVAIDAPAGGLSLVGFVDQTVGFGF